MAETFPHIAGGDIRPCRFVKVSTAANNTLLEADANEQIVGISQEHQRDAPQTGASDLAAASGQPIAVHQIGTVCQLEIGSGGVTRGANIKSDADGKGVLAATTGTTNQWIGAIALETASEGEFAKVLVHLMAHRPAIA